MRILGIHAHPDDLEILAGGTLALLAARKHQVTIVTMTPGDCGSADYGPEEIASIRRMEAISAASLIRARYHCAEFRDLAVFNDDASRRRVTEILRRTKPDLVITASPADYMCDHETTSALVRDALFGAPAPNYLTASEDAAEPLPAIPHLYFTQPVTNRDREGRAIAPDIVVNVESVFELKRQMLGQHQSQRQWLLKHHGIDDYLEQMDAWTRECGAMAGWTFGEGFRRYKGHPYPQTPLLEELLGPDLVRVVVRNENEPG